MTDTWNDLIHGPRWRSPETVWVEDDTEYSWEQVDELASAIEGAIRDHGAVRVVEVRSVSKLGCFAGQLAVWRAGCVALANDGNLGPHETGHVRSGLVLSVRVGSPPSVEPVRRSGERLPPARIPGEIVAVNFTSGSTGSRRAVGVTSSNLSALFGCRALDVPARDRLTSGSFATPTYDGWWFDTWRTVSAGGTVVCLPNVNEDVFAWPELVERYNVDRVLLPAAVVATIIAVAPACIADIPWVFSGGEQFQASTYRQARDAGLTNRFVNLYGPTEATFATHKYELPANLASATIPIGRPLDGCRQSLRELGEPGSGELIVAGPLVCAGYIERGALARRFVADDGEPSYPTGDVVRTGDDGTLVFAGRLDGQIKVNGIRVDSTALEHQVTGLSGVADCRVAQNGSHTVAFVRADPALRPRIESVVKRFSPAISVQLVDHFPVKPGGKVDTASLLNQHPMTDKSGQR